MSIEAVFYIGNKRLFSKGVNYPENKTLGKSSHLAITGPNSAIYSHRGEVHHLDRPEHFRSYNLYRYKGPFRIQYEHRRESIRYSHPSNKKSSLRNLYELFIGPRHAQ